MGVKASPPFSRQWVGRSTRGNKSRDAAPDGHCGESAGKATALSVSGKQRESNRKPQRYHLPCPELIQLSTAYSALQPLSKISIAGLSRLGVLSPFHLKKAIDGARVYPKKQMLCPERPGSDSSDATRHAQRSDGGGSEGAVGELQGRMECQG